MHELPRLLDQRLSDGRMRVAERGDRYAAAEVEITPPVHVEEMAACAVTEREVETAIARNDVFAEQLADRFELIPNDRRRRRHDFFHQREVFSGARAQAQRKFASESRWLGDAVWVSGSDGNSQSGFFWRLGEG